MTKFLSEFISKRGKGNKSHRTVKKDHPYKNCIQTIRRNGPTLITNPCTDLGLPVKKMGPIKKPTDFKLDTPRRGRKGFRV